MALRPSAPARSGLFRRFKVRHKLLGGLVIVGLAFGSAVGLLWVSGEQSRALLERIEEGEVPVRVVDCSLERRGGDGPPW